MQVCQNILTVCSFQCLIVFTVWYTIAPVILYLQSRPSVCDTRMRWLIFINYYDSTIIHCRMSMHCSLASPASVVIWWLRAKLVVFLRAVQFTRVNTQPFCGRFQGFQHLCFRRNICRKTSVEIFRDSWSSMFYWLDALSVRGAKHQCEIWIEVIFSSLSVLLLLVCVWIFAVCFLVFWSLKTPYVHNFESFCVF